MSFDIKRLAHGDTLLTARAERKREWVWQAVCALCGAGFLVWVVLGA